MGRPVKDMHGFRVGKLEVLSYAGSDKRCGQSRAYWNVRCDCGTEKQLSGAVLRKGQVFSCGCSQYTRGGVRFFSYKAPVIARSYF